MKCGKKRSIKKKLYRSLDYMGKIKINNDNPLNFKKQNNFYTENNFCTANNEGVSILKQLKFNSNYKITYSNSILKNEKQSSSDQYSITVTESNFDKQNKSIKNKRVINICKQQLLNLKDCKDMKSHNFYTKKFNEIFCDNSSTSKININNSNSNNKQSDFQNKSKNNIFNKKSKKNEITRNYDNFLKNQLLENDKKGKIVSLIGNNKYLEKQKKLSSNSSSNKIQISKEKNINYINYTTSSQTNKTNNNFSYKQKFIKSSSILHSHKKSDINVKMSNSKRSIKSKFSFSRKKKSQSHSHSRGKIVDIFNQYKNDDQINCKKLSKYIISDKNLTNSSSKIKNNLVKSTSVIKYTPIIYINNKKERSKTIENFYKTKKKYNLNSKSNNNKKNYIKNSFDIDNDPLFLKIKNLWEKIGGVPQKYQDIFKKLSKELKLENRKGFFVIEINNLSLILENIGNLNHKINIRNNLITKLKNLKNDSMKIEEITKLLCNLRKISIDIVNKYFIFNQTISYDVLNKKFNDKKIKNYDKSYLKKMQTDTNFLYQHEYLRKLFKFSENNDPFLITPSIQEENKENSRNTYNILPINDNISQQIRNCQYILLREKINDFTNINKVKKEKNEINTINNFIIRSYSTNNSLKSYCNYNKDNDNEEVDDKIIKISRNQLKSIDLYKEINITESNDNNINFNEELKVSIYNPQKDIPINELYSNYLRTISSKIKESFYINEKIDYYLNIGIYPKIILFKDNKSNIQGICTISYCSIVNLFSKILNITSISCTPNYQISNILLKLIEFCKNNEIIYDEIIFFLYFIKKDDSNEFKLDSELQEEIKSKSKFKWQSLENDGEHRKIKYHYVPNNIIIDKENSFINEDNNNNKINSFVNMNSYIFIKYNENIGINDITNNEHCKLYFVFNIIYNYLIVDNDANERDKYLKSFKGLKLKRIVRLLSDYNNVLITDKKNFKNDFNKNENYKAELFNKFNLIINSKNILDNSLCIGFTNIYCNFSSIIKIIIDNYEYNMISMSDLVVQAFKMSNNESDLIYFTKSEDEKISFIFYELTNNLKVDKKMIFNLVLRKILKKDSEEPYKSYNKICIPSFHYTNNNKNEDNKDEYMSYDIMDFEENFDFCLENISNKNVKFCYPFKDVEKNDDIKIIRNNFIIAVINQDLILDYCIPAMNIYYIEKNCWVKVMDNN